MSKQRKIKPVIDNQDKQRTYRVQKGRYKRAMENEFFFEAILIDYAILEDRLRSMIYHMGFLENRTSFKIWNKKASWLRDIVSVYKDKKENCQIGISNISRKTKIIRCVLKWVVFTEGGYQDDEHLSALKIQCEGLDIGEILSALGELQEWCDYRNEVIHSLMNKNLDSLSDELKVRAEVGMQLAQFFDNQGKLLKKGNRIRKNANLKMD